MRYNFKFYLKNYNEKNLLQVSERIPTIGTQLKILSTVKATMLGSQGSFNKIKKKIFFPDFNPKETGNFSQKIIFYFYIQLEIKKPNPEGSEKIYGNVMS